MYNINVGILCDETELFLKDIGSEFSINNSPYIFSFDIINLQKINTLSFKQHQLLLITEKFLQKLNELSFDIMLIYSKPKIFLISDYRNNHLSLFRQNGFDIIVEYKDFNISVLKVILQNMGFHSELIKDNLDTDILSEFLITLNKINHIILRENDEEILLSETCRLLVESRGYRSIWISIESFKGNQNIFINDGEKAITKKFKDYLSSGNITPCIEKVHKEKRTVIADLEKDFCEDCPIRNTDENNCSIFIPMLNDEKIIGIIGISKDKYFLKVQEEVKLLEDIAANLAYSISKIRLQKDNDLKKNQLIEANLFLQQIIDSIPVPLFYKDKDFVYRLCNEEFYKINALSKNEIIGKTVFELFSKEEAEVFNNADIELVESGNAQEYETTMTFNNGEKKDVVIKKYLHKNFSNEVIGLIGIIFDVTERNKALKVLSNNYNLYKGIYENSVLGIYRTTLDGKLLFANSSLLKLLEYEDINEIREHISDLSQLYFNENDRKILLEKLINDKSVDGFETKLIKKSGKIFQARIFARSVAELKNETEYIEGLIEDISAQKLAEKKLQDAVELAVKSENLKSMFLAQISHEIRTPINSIINFIDLVKEECTTIMNEELSENFKMINEAGYRIIRTIELLVMMSEIQSETLKIYKNKFDLLKDVIIPIKEKYLETIKSKKLELLYYQPNEECIVYQDKFFLSKIIENLVDNSVKFTTSGYIEISVEILESEYSIYISDSGIGMSKSYLNKLFSPFSQEDSGYSRKYDGTGLGLALVKNLCDLLNIEIDIKSTKNVGTKVKLLIEKEKIDY